MSRRGGARWLAPTLLAALVSTGAAASPLDQIGYGSRARALGGSGTATSEDFTATWYNPAAMVAARGIAPGIGFTHLEPRLEIDGRDTDTDSVQGIDAGFVLPGTLLGKRIAFGTGLHVPNKRVVRFLVLSRDTVRFAMWSNLTQRIAVQLPLAMRVTDWLDVGAGVSLVGDNSGGIDFVIRQEGRGVTEGSLEAAQIARFSPLAGVVLRPRDGLRLAAAFRGQVEIELDTPVVLRFDELTIPPSELPIIGASLLDVGALTVTHFQPRQVSAALAWEPDADWMLTAELTWRGWSEYVPPIPETRTVLEGGLADLLPDLPEFPVPDAGFRDTWQPSVGVEWRAHADETLALLVRGGYFFRPTPAPEPRGETNLVDADTHGVGFGLGLELFVLEESLKGPLRLDLHGQALFLESIRVTKDDPADPIGGYRASGSLWGGGLTVSVEF